MSLDEHVIYYELPDDNEEFNHKLDVLANSIIYLLEKEGATYEMSKIILNMCLDDIAKDEAHTRRL